jgi:hypothetical protein
VLELGTGLATAWLLDGMDRASRLISIETDEAVLAIAREALGADDCVSFVQADGGDWLRQAAPAQFDLIFADAWRGRDSHLDEALGALIGTAPSAWQESPTETVRVRKLARMSMTESARNVRLPLLKSASLTLLLRSFPMLKRNSSGMRIAIKVRPA